MSTSETTRFLLAELEQIYEHELHSIAKRPWWKYWQKRRARKALRLYISTVQEAMTSGRTSRHE